MALASANRVQLCYIPEATFGVVPVSGNPSNLRMTGETLNFNLTKEPDKEINATAQLTSTTTTGAEGGGDIKGHFQYGEYDRFLAGLMRSAWVPFGTNGVGAVFTCDITTTTITASVATTGTSLFTALQKGQWFQLIAPGNVGNNKKLYRVSTITAPTSTVITLDTSTPGTAASAIAACTVMASRLVNGTSLTSFTIERQVSEISQFMTFRGNYPSKFATSFASKALTEVTFSFIGKDMLPPTPATALPGSPVASLTFDIQNAVTGVGNLWENGVPLTSTYIKTITVDLDSGLRGQDAIGTLGLIGVGIGTFMAKGTISVYFADATLITKFLTDTFTSISFSSKDSSGNGYIFTYPRVQLTSAKTSAGSKDTDMMLDFEYTAYADMANPVPALRYTLLIDRFGAAVLP